MPQWRPLRPSQGHQEPTDPTRSSVDDLLTYLNTMTFGGNSYPLGNPGVTTTLAGDVEPAMHTFRDYAERAFSGNAIVFAAMAARQLVFSSVRFQWQEINNGRPGKLFGTGALTPLERPGVGGTTQDLASRMIQDADLTGNWYGIRDTPLARIGGDRTTFEIARIRPDWVDILRADRVIRSQHVGYTVAGIAYWEGGRTSGADPVIFFPGEYAHFAPYPDPLANWRGMSWLTPVAREIQADGQMTQHKQKYFQNGATPNLIVKYPSGAREEDMKKVKKLFEQKYEGVENAYKTLHIGGGADVTVVGNDMDQVDFKGVQGAGEVRIAAAAGVPAAILGISDSLSGSSLNAGNFSSARRRMSDGTMHPLWQQAAGSLQILFEEASGGMSSRISSGTVRLWYDARDIPFLREDAQEEAAIRQAKASTIRTYIDSGFEWDSAVVAVDTGDLSALKHTGLLSVQMQPPGEMMAGSHDGQKEKNGVTPPADMPAKGDAPKKPDGSKPTDKPGKGTK